jgi:peptidylprolyl isomerase
MKGAKDGDKVSLYYTGTLDDGTVFDLSSDEAPLEFTIGAGQVIPDFEQEVVGMEPGDTKEFTIPADRAYGEHNANLVFTVGHDRFPPGVAPEVGNVFQVERADAGPMQVVVVDVGSDDVSLDANHPLAGENLTFNIELKDILV